MQMSYNMKAIYLNCDVTSNTVKSAPADPFVERRLVETGLQFALSRTIAQRTLKPAGQSMHSPRSPLDDRGFGMEQSPTVHSA